MFRNPSNFAHRKIENITVEAIERRLKEENYPEAFIDPLLNGLKKRQANKTLTQWQADLMNLHYRMPKEFNNKPVIHMIYENCPEFIESQIIALEKESKLPWRYYSGEPVFLNDILDKTYLVMRIRISDVIVDLTN